MDIQSSEDEEDDEDNEEEAADNDIDTIVKGNSVQNQESPSKVWKRDENLLRILAKHWIGMIPWKVCRGLDTMIKIYRNTSFLQIFLTILILMK